MISSGFDINSSRGYSGNADRRGNRRSISDAQLSSVVKSPAFDSSCDNGTGVIVANRNRSDSCVESYDIRRLVIILRRPVTILTIGIVSPAFHGSSRSDDAGMEESRMNIRNSRR